MRVLEDQVLTMLRGQVAAIILGVVFLFIGLAACGIAVIRGQGGVRLLLWFGILSGMYGTRILANVPAVLKTLPQSARASGLHVIAIISYLIIIPGLLFWLELSRGKLRRFLQIAAIAGSLIGIAGIWSTLFTKSSYAFMLYTNLLVIFVFLVLAIVISVPALASRFGVIRSRVSEIGILVLALAAIYSNIGNFLRLPNYRFLEPVAFAVFVFSLGYVAVQRIFTDERRLFSIENELAIAREIQSSILPRGIPEINTLNISAAYRPMTAVAGDFYEFIPVDRSRFGVLIADVAGHGVPAALIAAMMKVAMQSVVHCAQEPREVLLGLSRVLSGQLRGQLARHGCWEGVVLGCRTSTASPLAGG